MSDETGANLPAEANADDQLELWGEMLAVERERIASRDRAVEAMREGFARLDAVDERQFRYHTDRLHRDDAYRNRRLSHVIQLTRVGAGVGVAFVGLALAMLFWGGDAQRHVAFQLITHALAAGGFLAIGLFLGRRPRG